MITRSGWKARPARCSTPLPIGRTRGFGIHYSGTAAEQDMDGAAVMRAHQRFHQDTRGWCDVAYTFEVDQRGNVYEGRGYGNRTAANGTNQGNDDFYAICFQGADKAGREDFTKAAQAAIISLFLDYKRRTGRWPEVRPHSSFVSTSCPGDEIRAWIDLEPWKVQPKPGPLPIPKWWWRWVAWRLGEGQFKPHGPRAAAVRKLTGAPRLIPPWAWARLVLFLQARKTSG